MYSKWQMTECVLLWLKSNKHKSSKSEASYIFTIFTKSSHLLPENIFHRSIKTLKNMPYSITFVYNGWITANFQRQACISAVWTKSLHLKMPPVIIFKLYADYPVIQRNTIKIVMSRKMFFFPHECPTPEIQADTLVIPSANAKHSTCADINLYQSD